MARLLIDLTQYVGHPVTTGVQRTLWQLTKHWSGRTVEAWCGALVADEMVVVSPAAMADVIGMTFAVDVEADGSDPESVRRASMHTELAKRREFAIAPSSIDLYFDAYLLPEPTYRSDVLAIAKAMVDHPLIATFGIVYDAIPQTDPWLYRNPHQLGTSPLFRTLGRFDHLACISDAAASVVERRIRRDDGADIVVVRPGADGFEPGPATAPNEPRFVAIGTIEPRKRYDAIVGAAERLWAAGHPCRLEVYGRPLDTESPLLLDRMAKLRATRVDFTWHEAATDEQLRTAVLDATAVVFVSNLEGYGLPPLEALALGVPVIVTDDLPSLEHLPADGQLRLHDITTEAVAAALEQAADPVTNASLRRAAAQLTLPTWTGFAADIETWVSDRLARKGTPADPSAARASRGAS